MNLKLILTPPTHSVLVCVVTVIVSNQCPTASYSYGSVCLSVVNKCGHDVCVCVCVCVCVYSYQRVCVLAVFSLTVVLILGALSLLRHRYTHTHTHTYMYHSLVV